MKAIATFFVFLLSGLVTVAVAQQFFHSYNGVNAQTIGSNEVDSVVVEEQGNIKFYGAGAALLTLMRSDVDSMLIHGSVPFAVSPTIWEIGDDQTTQYWTDWIAYDGNNKRGSGTLSSMAIGTTPDYRDNAGYKGFYYNWYYVDANVNKICPPPFRVPTDNDFKNMDILLGGTGERQDGISSERQQKYLDWGLDDATKGGRINNQGVPQYAASYVYLWSMTDYDATHAYQFLYNAQVANSHNVVPVNSSSSITKSYGLPVRCVKD